MSERHEKWQPVEPGHIIPAGQQYRVEFDSPSGVVAHEIVPDEPRTVDARYGPWFVDSSWRPPLNLPLEPTWGIVRLPESGLRNHLGVHRWALRGERFVTVDHRSLFSITLDRIADFIPLTPEQVARIEGAR